MRTDLLTVKYQQDINSLRAGHASTIHQTILSTPLGEFMPFSGSIIVIQIINTGTRLLHI